MDVTQSSMPNREDGERIKLELQRQDDEYAAISINGSRYLHHAAKYGELNTIRQMIKCGYDVNVQNLSGITPLMFAISDKKKTAMKILLAAGADMFLRDHKNRHSLNRILEMNEIEPVLRSIFLRELRKKCCSIEEMAQILIDAGCRLYQVPYAKSVKLTRYFLKKGYPINEKQPVVKSTALHVAVASEDVRSVKVLLKNGANVKALDMRNYSCLFYLYGFNRNKHSAAKVAILKILLPGLENFSTTCDVHGHFQIGPILESGSCEAVQVILNSRVNLLAEDASKQSLLHYLAKNRNPGISDELTKHLKKFDINKIDKIGQTSLHKAVLSSSVRMVKFLLEHGADPNCIDYDMGHPPIFQAIAESLPGREHLDNKCTELLLQFSADPQYVKIRKSGSHITILRISLRDGPIDRTKLAIAQIAINEGLGTPIHEVIRSQIKSHDISSKYFKRCRWILNEKIADSVTLLNLLTADKMKMAKYLSNECVALKLKRLSYKLKLKFPFPFYRNTLWKRWSDGMKYKKLKGQAVRAIGKIYQNKFHKTDLVVDRTIEYLNDFDLQQLCQM